MMNEQNDAAPCPDGEPRINQDLCQDLCSDLLDEAEAGRLLAHLQVCSVCETALLEYARAFEHAQSDLGDLPRLLADHIRRHQQGGVAATSGASSSGPRRRWRIPALAVGSVAAAAVLLVLIPDILRRSEPGLVPGILPPVELDTITRAPSGSTDRDELATGLRAYERGGYREAATSLSRVSSEDDYFTLAQAFLGSSLAWDGDYDAAQMILQSIDLEVLPSPWDREALWTLLVCWSREDLSARADSLAGVLAKGNDEVAMRARAYLSKNPDLD